MTETLTPPYVPQIRLYQNWLRDARGLSFESYEALRQWSTTDLNAFWQSIWDYFDLQSPTPHSVVCDGAPMPHTRWFNGAQVNYAQQVLRHVDAAHAGGFAAILSHNEKSLGRQVAQSLSWPELRRQVASLALHLQAQGVQPGDRVAAYLPNIPEAAVAFLATASIGAVWSICAPDMGTHAVLDRFRQIEPKVLIGVDGVSYGGRDHDRRPVLAELLTNRLMAEGFKCNNLAGISACSSTVKPLGFCISEASFPSMVFGAMPIELRIHTPMLSRSSFLMRSAIFMAFSRPRHEPVNSHSISSILITWRTGAIRSTAATARW